MTMQLEFQLFPALSSARNRRSTKITLPCELKHRKKKFNGNFLETIISLAMGTMPYLHSGKTSVPIVHICHPPHFQNTYLNELTRIRAYSNIVCSKFPSTLQQLEQEYTFRIVKDMRQNTYGRILSLRNEKEKSVENENMLQYTPVITTFTSTAS